MDADDDTLAFAAWLDVLAPVHARLYLRHRSPVANAIFDLRAAMFYDSESDNDDDIWLEALAPGEIWERAQGTLSSCGILLPRRLFDAVWQLYCDCLGAFWWEAYLHWVKVGTDLRTENEWARVRLLEAARDAIRWGPDRACRVRYGCNPD